MVTKRRHSSTEWLARTSTRKSLPSYQMQLYHARGFREAQIPTAILNVAMSSGLPVVVGAAT
jgi:hypothetical protein